MSISEASYVKCSNCSAEIADKAIVCYRCGTPTLNLPPVSPKAAPAKRNLWLWLAFLIAIMVFGIATCVYFRLDEQAAGANGRVRLEAPRYKLSGHVHTPA
jgi:hypothetical protein